MNQENINKLLLHFLKTIYHYERNEIAEFSLSFQEVYALQFLEQKGLGNIGEIADELRIKHFTASRLITRLEKKGYVNKNQKNSDKRISTAVITKAGINIVKAIEKKHSKTILKNLKNNPDLNINMFIETAKNIHRILDINIEESEK